MEDFHEGLYLDPKLAAYLPQMYPPFDRSEATSEMVAWVESNFTPLVEFAFYDSESETGFAWPDEDLIAALQDRFGNRYPASLIEDVGADLEVDRGPWGIEDYGDDEK